jgi:hypothetical protein
MLAPGFGLWASGLVRLRAWPGLKSDLARSPKPKAQSPS